MYSFIYALIIGWVNYKSSKILKVCGGSLGIISSLAGGITVAYLFLQLLPEFSMGVIKTNRLLFIYVLVGFSLFHVVEKYIHKNSSRRIRLRELAIEDSTISFIYHFIIGIILVNLEQFELFETTLFFFPILLHTAVSTLPIDITKNKRVKLILSTATLWGVLFAKYVFGSISDTAFYSLLGFVIGAMVFTVIRHSLPTGKKGRPEFFVIGAILYTVLIFFVWQYQGFV